MSIFFIRNMYSFHVHIFIWAHSSSEELILVILFKTVFNWFSRCEDLSVIL